MSADVDHYKKCHNLLTTLMKVNISGSTVTFRVKFNLLSERNTDAVPE